MKSGQTITAVIMWGVGLSASVFLGGYALFSSEIRTTNENLKENESRVAVLEEAISTIKLDQAEIKADLKIILQRLK